MPTTTQPPPDNGKGEGKAQGLPRHREVCSPNEGPVSAREGELTSAEISGTVREGRHIPDPTAPSRSTYPRDAWDGLTPDSRFGRLFNRHYPLIFGIGAGLGIGVYESFALGGAVAGMAVTAALYGFQFALKIARKLEL